MIKSILKFLNLEKTKIFYFSLLFIEKIIILAFHFYFVTKLSSEMYGIYNQTNFISSLFQNLLMFGAAIPFIINYSKDSKAKTYYFNFFVQASVILTVVIFSLIILFNSFFSELIYGQTVYYSYFLILFLVTVSDVYSEYIIVSNRVENKLMVHSKFILLRSIIKVISLIGLFFVLQDFYISFLISSVLYLIYSIYVSSNTLSISYISLIRGYNEFKGEIRSTFFEGLKFVLIYVLTTSSSLLINLLIVGQLDIATLAIYNFNYVLASIPISILGYITYYSLPEFSKYSFNSKIIYRSNLIKDITLSLIIFIVFFLIVFFSYDFIISVVKDYYSNKKLFVIIFSANLIFMFNNFMQFPLLTNKNYSRIVYITFISLLCNIYYLYSNPSDFNIITPVIGFLIANIVSFLLLLLTQIEFRINKSKS